MNTTGKIGDSMIYWIQSNEFNPFQVNSQPTFSQMTQKLIMIHIIKMKIIFKFKKKTTFGSIFFETIYSNFNPFAFELNENEKKYI